MIWLWACLFIAIMALGCRIGAPPGWMNRGESPVGAIVVAIGLAGIVVCGLVLAWRLAWLLS